MLVTSRLHRGSRPLRLPSPAKPALDKVLALGAIKASSSQDVDKLGITLTRARLSTVKLSGSVNVPGASKVYRFKTVNRCSKPARARLQLKLASKAKRAVKRALRRKKS